MSSKQWTDYCPSIKPQDEKYTQVIKIVEKTGCISQNQILTDCLKKNKKDWRYCQNQSTKLALCLQQNKNL